MASLTQQRHSIAKEQELRFEVGSGEEASASSSASTTSTNLGPAFVKLLSGNAEVFGVELLEGRVYTFQPGRKIAVFTWYGCEVALWGNVSGVYVASDTPMTLYAGLHQRLEARREEARIMGLHGPRVCVVGPTDSGKSTLCRILLSYAARVGRSPLFVDTDLGQGEVSLPGSLSALTIDRSCLSVEEDGFLHAATGAVGATGHDSLSASSSSSTGGAGGRGAASSASSSSSSSVSPAAASALPLPLVYFFGHLTPGDAGGGEVFKNSVHRLADTVTRRLTHDEHARVSGCIVNTMGFIDGLGYDILVDTIKTMACDVVVVQGNDRLFARLSEDLKSMKLPTRPTLVTTTTTTTTMTTTGMAEGSSGASAAASSSSSSAPFDSKSVALLKLPRSGGVVERARNTRRDARKQRIKEYFYGPTRVVLNPPPANAVGAAPKLATLPPVLSPVSLTLGFDEVTIVRVGGIASDVGILPIGKSTALDPLRTQVVTPSPGQLNNHLLGVSFATSEKQVPHVNCAGFLHV